jgi:hypothetical protein
LWFWINRFLDRLKPAIKQRLGAEAEIWIDNASRLVTGTGKRTRSSGRRLAKKDA